jgi:hypothetical protein
MKLKELIAQFVKQGQASSRPPLSPWARTGASADPVEVVRLTAEYEVEFLPPGSVPGA